MARQSQQDWDKIYQEAVWNIATSGGPSLILRCTSEEAVNQVPDLGLDFCFLDADHTYEAVKRDIELWEPKCRHLIMGHDMGSNLDKRGIWGVTKAVYERYGDRRVHRYKGMIWAVHLS